LFDKFFFKGNLWCPGFPASLIINVVSASVNSRQAKARQRTLFSAIIVFWRKYHEWWRASGFILSVYMSFSADVQDAAGAPLLKT